jgi:hypothetical protein
MLDQGSRQAAGQPGATSTDPRPGDPWADPNGVWPRRVAIFTETFLPRVDGIVNTLCWVLRGLVEAGVEPLVVAPGGNTAAFPGVRIVGVSSTPFPLYPEVRLVLHHAGYEG